MKLEAIIARSGLGKTEYILEDIEKNKDNSKIIILTPEQNSYNFEKTLCERFTGTFNIDVMNFTTLSKKIVKMLGIYSLSIDENINLFYLYNAIKNLQDNDNFLVKRVLQDTNFLEVVQSIIKELKQYNFTIEKIEEYLKINNLEKTHKEKLTAVLEIYTEYDKLQKIDKKFDKEDYMNQLLFYIDYVDLSEYIFYIDAYYNFTSQEYYYIKKLVEKSKKVVITIISDPNKYFNFSLESLISEYDLQNIKYKKIGFSDIYSNNNYSLDIFRKSHEIIANINESMLNSIDFSIIAMIYYKNKVHIIDFTINSNNEISSYNVKEKDDVRYKNLSNKYLAFEYGKVFNSLKNIDDSIIITKARTKELELKQVAREILRLKKEFSLKDNDIAILYRDTYYERYSYIFDEYHLNLHIDKDNSVENHRLIRFLKNVLNYNNQNVISELLSIFKTRLTNFEEHFIQKSIQYILFGELNLKKSEVNKRLKNIDKDNFKNILTRCKTLGINIKSNIDVKNIIKNIEKEITTLTVDDLENILIKKIIRKKEDFLKETFIEEFDNYRTWQLEICRTIILEFLDLIECISSDKSKKIKIFIKNIDKVLDYCDIKMLLNKDNNEYDSIEDLELDSIDRQVYKKVLLLLDNIVESFGEQKIYYEKFKELLILSFGSIKYRNIPELNESIIMSKIDLAKVENKKYVFVIGFNKSSLPKFSTISNILDDNDKLLLLEKNIHLTPTSKEFLIDEEFVSYIALTRSKNRVYISYSELDNSFREDYASPYLETVRNIFPDLKIGDTDKILEFNINNLYYYFDNIKEYYVKTEFNYIYSKILKRKNELTSNGIKDDTIDKLNLLYGSIYNKFENHYEATKDINLVENLSDDIFFEKILQEKDYVKILKENNELFISDTTKDKFLKQKGEKFSNFSFSKITDFQKNPYYFFIKRVLGIKEPLKEDITSFITGSFIHAVLSEDELINLIEKEAEKLSLIDLDEYDEKLEKISYISNIEKIIFNSTNPDIKKLLELLETEVIHSYILKNLVNRLNNALKVEIKYYAISQYRLEFTEKRFELDITSNEIRGKSSDGIQRIYKLNKNYNIPNIRFSGIIDRIDKKGKNISIVDYKSSKKDFSLEDLYYGRVSQVLCYSLAGSILFNISTMDILGVFYREIAKIDKDLKEYRLRGILNKDILEQDIDRDIVNELFFLRMTKKGIHATDDYKAYSSPEFNLLESKNIENIMILLEKIYSFGTEYKMSYEEEKETIYGYANGNRIEFKEENEKIKNSELKKIVLTNTIDIRNK